MKNRPTVNKNPEELSSATALGQFFIDTQSVKRQPKNKDRNGNPDYSKQRTDGTTTETDAPVNSVEAFSRIVNDKRRDNKNLLESVPDFKAIVKLVVAGVQQPNTLEAGSITYSFPSQTTIDPDIQAAVLNTIEAYVEPKYNLTKDMEKEITELLAGSGSVFKVILPPDKVYEAITADTEYSMESLDKAINTLDSVSLNGHEIIPEQIGVFNATGGLSMESLFKGDKAIATPEFSEYGVKVKAIDNVTYLRNYEYSQIRLDMYMDEKFKSMFGTSSFSMESASKYKYKEGKKTKYRLPVRKIKAKSKRRGKGNSLDIDSLVLEDSNTSRNDVEYMTLLPATLIDWPSTSIIPCQKKGAENTRLGYLGLVDNKGQPLVMDEDKGATHVKQTGSRDPKDSDVIKRIKQDLFEVEGEREKNRSMEKQHRDILDHFKNKVHMFLTDAISNGVMGEAMNIVPTDEAVLTMLYAAMAEREIRIVFIPDALCQHYAFEYDQYGLGSTMFDSGRVIFQMKAALVYSQVYGAIQGSRPISNVTFNIDPDDPTPKKTAMKQLEAYLKSLQQAMPWSDITPAGLEKNVLMSGINAIFEGNDNLPKMQTEVKQSTRDIQTIDRDIIEMIDDICYKSMGWTKEAANWFNDADLATTIISSNLQVARRIHHYQNVLLRHKKEYLQKALIHDGEFCAKVILELSGAGRSGKGELSKLGDDIKTQINTLKSMLPEILRDINLGLPAPDVSVVNAKEDELSAYLSIFDSVIEGYIYDDMVDSGRASRDEVRGAKASLRALLIRRLNRERNYVPELNEMFDADGKSYLAEESGEHLENLINSFIPLATAVAKGDMTIEEARKKAEEERQKEIDKKNAEQAEEEGGDEPPVDTPTDEDADEAEEEVDAPSDDEADDESGGSDDPFGDFSW